MIKLLTDILHDVRVVLDENAISDALIADADTDTLTLDEIIKSKVLDAVRRVEIDAPSYLLEGGHHFGDAVYWSRNESFEGVGCTLLPDDFMRLVVFEMTDWERPVYSAISTTDPEYEQQRSRFKGIRGNVQKPVCAIAIRPEGKVLEFYSCNDNDAKVSKAVYLPYPSIDEYGGIDLCERCYESIVYMTASLVLSTYGDAEKSTAMAEQAKNALV